jgi:hypothetical protein
MAGPFLARVAEAQEFSEQWLPRRVLPSFGSRWPMHGAAPEDLEGIVQAVCRRAHAESATINVIAVGFAVEQRDGMSWSAEKAHQMVEADFPDHGWEVRCVSGRAASGPGELDQLRDLFGDTRPIRKAARACGFVPELRVHLAWWLGVRSLYAIGAGGAVLISHVAADAGGGVTAAAGLAGAGAVFGGLKLFGSEQRITIGPSGEADEKIAAALEQEHAASTEERFRDTLAMKLVPIRPRIVIVDDYGALGERTRDTIASYLEGAVPRRFPELWLMFERARRSKPDSGTRGREPFTAALLSALAPGRRVSLWRGRQMTLERADRETLIWKRENAKPRANDPRLRRRSVAEVADKRGWNGAALREELDATLGVQILPVQRAFALLALATIAPGTVDRNSLAAGMSESPGRWASVKRELLRAWFPPSTHSQAAVEQAVQGVIDKLGALLDDLPAGTPPARARVTQPHADAIGLPRTWGEFELPPQDLGHAFWALDARAKLGSRRHPLAGDQLVIHLRALESAHQLRTDYGDAVADALFDAAIDGIEVALALALGGIVREADTLDRPAWDTAPGLLMQARLLLDAGSGTADTERCATLLAGSWASYMLTGEPAIADTLVNLSTELGHDGEVKEQEALLLLYRQMQPRTERASLWPYGSERAETILDHARARAGLIATAVRPMVVSEADAALLLAAEADFRETASGTVTRVAARLQEASPSAFQAIDFLTASILTLADAVILWRDPSCDSGTRESLDRAARLATAAIEQRTSMGSAEHVVASGLARQLDATSRGSEAALRASESTRELAIALQDLDELHIMWHNLEYAELADQAAVAGNVLRVVAGAFGRGEGPRRSGDYLLGVSEGDRGAVHRATLEFLVSAARDGGRLETNPKAALPLVEGACTVLDARLGDDLTVAVCNVAIRFGCREEQAKLERLVKLVLDPRHGASQILEVPDDEVFFRARKLLACCVNIETVREIGLLDAIEQRRGRIGSPWAIDKLDQEIEQFEFTRVSSPDSVEVRARASLWRDRVWGAGPPVAASVSPSVEHKRFSHDQYAYFLAEVWKLLEADDLIPDVARLVEEGARKPNSRNYVLLASRLVRRLDEIGSERGLTVASPSRPDRATTTTSNTGGVRISFGGPLTSDRAATRSETEIRLLALNLIRRDIDAHLHTFSPLTVMSMYHQLAVHFDEDRAKNIDRREYYRAQDERLWEERLLYEHRQGHVFEIFWHHYERLHELPLDRPRDEIKEQLALDPAEFLESATTPVPPLVFGSDGRPEQVSSTFICLGYHLLHCGPNSPARQPAWDIPRKELQQHAQEQLRNFYWLLTERTPISSYLRQVLDDQRERFEEQND